MVKSPAMSSETFLNVERGPEASGSFAFRGAIPGLCLGTASDRYSGWLGQIYTPSMYEGRSLRRKKSVGGKVFEEEVLPVDSVEEYFRHFAVMELDFTFYSPLQDKKGKATSAYKTLEAYRSHLREGDGLLLKVPQAVCARGTLARGEWVPNPRYLDPALFADGFYGPACALLDPWIRGFIFEQGYQRKGERETPEGFAAALETFFSSVPGDPRYHLEIRTAALLTDPLFSLLARRGIGQVLSHWTWLPRLAEQFERSGKRFFNRQGDCVIRLMTPLGMRYEDAYQRAFPFTDLIPGMMSPHMVQDTVRLVEAALSQGVTPLVVVNNRSGGNAPRIAEQLVMRLLQSPGAGPSASGNEE